ncbi:MAG: GNAT family N-acetyltransferase [Paracoccaceae bacterium]
MRKRKPDAAAHMVAVLSGFSTRAVAWDNVNALLRLKLAPGQETFVAPNAVTIAQAAYEPAAELLALYASDAPVGLMALLDMTKDGPSITDDEPRDGAYIWRLMVDASQQGNGYGKAALDAAAAWAQARGLKKLYVSTVPGDGSPRPYYEASGFVATGDIVDGEDMLLRLL